ncbi:MAG: hypothetical protein A2Y97_14405 [Nitrospirae bacterium RBG_13_39_12]|nr:MAG: hypothetical protein A2Y97_14405 [Nitrospirae bacterium RBG_13_39_12]
MHYSGTEKFILNLASMFQKLGNQVKVITYSFYEDSFYNQSAGKILISEFTYRGIPVLAFRNRRIPEDINLALHNSDFSKVSSELIAKEAPDIVHVGHPMRVGELIKALEPFRIPYLVTLTDFFLICPKVILFSSKNVLCAGPDGGDACLTLCPELQNNFITNRLAFAKDVLFKAKKVIAPSIFLASVFKKEFENLDLKIINHGLDFAAVKINRRNNKAGDNIVFCYAGTLAPHKGIHILISAFKKIISNRVSLKVYGSGPDELYINSLKAMAKGDERIECCGTFSEHQFGDIFSKVDAVVIPSLCYESYSMVLHEALACNVPVIVSKAGGMAEKIRDCVNGFTFTVGDSKNLKEILENMANNAELINTLRANIKYQVIATTEQEAYAYEREYRKILTKRNDG